LGTTPRQFHNIDDYSIPGISGVYSPWGQLHDNSITLKPGETKETYYTLHTGEGGLGKVAYTLFRVRKEYGSMEKIDYLYLKV